MTAQVLNLGPDGSSKKRRIPHGELLVRDQNLSTEVQANQVYAHFPKDCNYNIKRRADAQLIEGGL